MKVPKYYTTFQASRLLGVSLPTVVNYIKAGILVAHKTPGGHRRIAETDLVDFARRYNMPLSQEILGRTGPVKILVVDDDEDFLDMICEFLGSEAVWEARAANSGFAAGMILGNWRPDVMLMDLEMPGMDGFQALDELRKEAAFEKIPVIACTGHDDAATLKKVTAAGFVTCVNKPLDLDRLREVIQEQVSAEPED